MSVSTIAERAHDVLKTLCSARFAEQRPITDWTHTHNGVSTPVSLGATWTDADAESVLTASVCVPSTWAGRRVGLWFELPESEPLLLVDGAIVQALDYNHGDVVLHESANGDELHTLEVRCYSPSRGTTATLQNAALVCIDTEKEAHYFDLLTATLLLDALPEDSDTGVELRRVLAESLDTESPAPLRAFFETPLSNDAPKLALLGHSHLDLAYLWTIQNTRAKLGRTFATALKLMDEFPEYVFTQSQPQLYAWCKELYPELYQKITARIAEGRWEPTGGMWVEADCNITSGESLIRQILLGNQFFQREFGVTTRVLWLPDVFGYPASLPQIARGCGLEYFLTSKISWSDTNRMPSDTFLWRGIDGTTLPTHFLTAPEFHRGLDREISTYNGELTPFEVKRAWERYQNKSYSTEIAHCVGHGDGGGGPTREMLEVGRRLVQIPSLSRCAFSRADHFFERLFAKNTAALSTWNGELYLENHRGTYTSQGRIKKGNRDAERALRSAEVFSVLAATLGVADYPKGELDALWQTLLTHQFHDILPGTCIRPAIEQAEQALTEVVATAEALAFAPRQAIAENVAAEFDSVVVFNPTDTLRPADVFSVTIPNNLVRKGRVEFADEDGMPLVSQFLALQRDQRVYFVLLPEVGPLGYRTLTVGKAGGEPEESTVAATLTGDGATLENELVIAHFDRHGELISLIHKLADDESEEITEREALSGPARLVSYTDKPRAYDAWNIDVDYRESPAPLADEATVTRYEVLENGPVRASLRVVRQFRSSTITQRIRLHAHSARVEFATEIDWHEHQTLLKVHVPTAVLTTRATYDIQFGVVERPTHANTSWDAAKFEVCGHRWADLSEGDYGVSILSECKYGYDAVDSTLSLTLLKSGIYPDPEADQGIHDFTYAIFPHTGDWRNETVDEAHAMTNPLLAHFAAKNPKGELPVAYPLASVDDQGIVIETIKQSEDDPNAVVVRLYEAFQTRGTATLTLGFEIAEAFETNLVEENPVPIDFEENTIVFTYRPFEIKTFLIRPT